MLSLKRPPANAVYKYECRVLRIMPETGKRKDNHWKYALLRQM
jgi:hypothetical protein